MARGRQDLISRLADRGEEAITRLAKAPGAKGVLDVANSLRDRVDELQKRVLGVETLEARVARLEKRLDELAGTAKKRATARKPAARRSATKKTTT